MLTPIRFGSLPFFLYYPPLQAITQPLKQMPIVQTHHWLTRLHIDRDPAPL